MVLDVVFAVLVVATFIYEVVAIVNKRMGDTISERNWDARDYSWWSRLLVDSLVVWGFWHLFIDVEFFVRGTSWVDIPVVMGIMALSLWTWHRNET